MLNADDNKSSLEGLAQLGVFVEVAGYARNRRFRLGHYVRLFDEPRGETND